MISCLSEPMSGLKTGSSTHSFTAAMFSRVCEATCPSDSPVTMALAPSILAMRSATENIMRRYMITRSDCGQARAISRWHSPKGTTYMRPTMPAGRSWSMMSLQSHSLSSVVTGRPEKCTGTQTAPRRPSIQVATGESKPLESSVTTLPAEPTGRPPTPMVDEASAYT